MSSGGGLGYSGSECIDDDRLDQAVMVIGGECIGDEGVCQRVFRMVVGVPHADGDD
jgi:hypothetical protein